MRQAALTAMICLGVALTPVAVEAQAPARRGLGTPPLDTKLEAPDWLECDPASEEVVCMNLEQIKHVLKIYATYLHLRTTVELQLSLLNEYQEKYDALIENTQRLMVQLDAAHLSMEKRQQLETSAPPGAAFTTTELFVYVALAVLGGYGLSYIVHH